MSLKQRLVDVEAKPRKVENSYVYLSLPGLNKTKYHAEYGERNSGEIISTREDEGTRHDFIKRNSGMIVIPIQIAIHNSIITDSSKQSV